ncbi:hypothetical protein FH5_03050 [Priestia endophytica]|nr:hypothetical protein FH5_03050 [Priestia endophytica]
MERLDHRNQLVQNAKDFTPFYQTYSFLNHSMYGKNFQ